MVATVGGVTVRRVRAWHTSKFLTVEALIMQRSGLWALGVVVDGGNPNDQEHPWASWTGSWPDRRLEARACARALIDKLIGKWGRDES